MRLPVTPPPDVWLGFGMRWGQPSPSPNPIAFLGQNGQGFSSAQGWAKFLDPTGSSSGLSTPAWGLPTQRDCRSGSTAFLPLPLHVCWHSGLPCPRARVGRYSEQVLALQASCSASTLGRRALHKPQRAPRLETPPGALHPPTHRARTHIPPHPSLDLLLGQAWVPLPQRNCGSC